MMSALHDTATGIDEFNGKRVLVTGGTKGEGQEITDR